MSNPLDRETARQRFASMATYLEEEAKLMRTLEAVALRCEPRRTSAEEAEDQAMFEVSERIRRFWE